MNILIFKIEDVAYSSTRIFADELGKCFMQFGVNVTYFDAKERPVTELESLCGQHFDAMIDFNSKLPSVVFEDNNGTSMNFLDTIDAPFFNYIVDHPIYHHKNLQVLLKNYHTICIDDNHAAYVRQYYPHMQNVMTMPLGAIMHTANQNIADIRNLSSSDDGALVNDNYNFHKCSNVKMSVKMPLQSEQEWYQRNNAILFLGTYLSPDEYWEMIAQFPEPMRVQTTQVIALLLEHPQMTYEEAVTCVLQKQDFPLDDMKAFRVTAQMSCFADLYVRAYRRQQVLQTFAQTGVPMVICGEQYDLSPMTRYSNVQILPQVSYMEGLDLMRQYRYVLNIMPGFQSGIHDRIVNAMYQQAVCITDSSKRIEQCFDADKEFYEYTLDDTKQISELAEKIKQADTDAAVAHSFYEMSAHGKVAVQSMTFLEIAKKILSCIK